MTLVEVCLSLAIGSVAFMGIILGYVQISDRAQWSAYSLAAQSLATQAVEQARGGKWDPTAWPPMDEIAPTNFTTTETLDVPVSGQPVLATNYVRIRNVSLTPPIRELRVDCVWCLTSRPISARGPFTNSAVTLRACDQ